ncbi:hypothetical protein ERC79_15865 [Rhodococcus sp. ABRD24]|uniref:hypothetical protein n=1 Tax=Rhodococcus sp. ABRD24 TaxID=2507582 RepID=UPI001039AE5B|nr:hypothetical protein [Rhodococcus sp. ABRD24]QBJ97254.1 hypothetical protein ERC79_15865 [Rhodococcus sp. ABRD24]
MSRISMRRFAAATAAAALVATGVTVGLGSGVAGAAPTCSPSSNTTKNDISTWGVTHTYSKTVMTEQAAADTEVTYKIVVGTTGIGNPYVDRITDIPPVGFGAPVRAQVTAYHLPLGQVTEPVTPVVDGIGWKVTSTGWFVNSGNPVTLEITYKVPGNVSVGDQVVSRGISTGGTVGVAETFSNLTACFTVRAKNAGESVNGSLDGAGLGSSDGQMSSTGSISDVLGDTISRILQNGS